jgi:hypothetical protein
VFACYPATDNENWTLRLCLLPVEIEAEEMPSAGVRVTSMTEQPVCSSPRACGRQMARALMAGTHAAEPPVGSSPSLGSPSMAHGCKLWRSGLPVFHGSWLQAVTGDR